MRYVNFSHLLRQKNIDLATTSSLEMALKEIEQKGKDRKRMVRSSSMTHLFSSFLFTLFLFDCINTIAFSELALHIYNSFSPQYTIFIFSHKKLEKDAKIDTAIYENFACQKWPPKAIPIFSFLIFGPFVQFLLQYKHQSITRLARNDNPMCPKRW